MTIHSDKSNSERNGTCACRHCCCSFGLILVSTASVLIFMFFGTKNTSPRIDVERLCSSNRQWSVQ